MTGTMAVMRRLARLVVVVMAVAVLSWLLVEAAPGSPGERAARAAGVLPPDDAGVSEALRARLIEQVVREHDLDRSLPVRIAGYLGGLVRLDFGRSWRDGEPVAGRLAEALAPTVFLVGTALLLALLLGLGAALLSARRPGGPLDLGLAGLAALALALPPVWVAIAALRLLAAGQPWHLLPAAGLDSAAAAVLPLLTLALVPGFVIARHARAALIDALDAPWTIAARARGASRWRVVAVHGLRVALPAVAPLVVVLTAYLLGATVVIEQVFAIRGLGSLLVDAAARGDAPVVVGVSVVAAALLALVSALVDLGAVRLDPRLREDGGRG